MIIPNEIIYAVLGLTGFIYFLKFIKEVIE